MKELSPEDRQKLILLYQCGTSKTELMHRFGFTTLMEISLFLLDNIAPVQKQEKQKHVHYSNLPGKMYKEYHKTSLERHYDAQESCLHDKWIKRCSCCGKVLASDAVHEPESHEKDIAI